MSRCGLCLQDRVLRKSHLIPKSLYKATKNAFPGSGNDVVLSSIENKSAVYTDSQVVAPFLCDTCETILSKNGERIVCGECYRGGSGFVLLDKVKKAKGILVAGGERLINPIKETINLNSDTYWRCCMKAVLGS